MMHSSSRYCHLLLLAVTIAMPQLARVASGESYNVVFILVDDWGWSDAATLGSDFFETPHIDSFAKRSMTFEQAYAASPVCSPTRAAILTGKDPARLHMTIWHEGAVSGGAKHRPWLEAAAEPNLPRDEVTLAELFQRQGYRTAHLGKWHLGKAAYYPETQGYDVNIGGTYWGAPATFFYPYRGQWSQADPELRYVPLGVGKPGDYLTDRLTDHAVELLQDHRDQPFFMSLWFHTVHTPIQAKPNRIRYFRRKSLGLNHQHATYAAMVASLDDNVGRVLRALEALQLVDRTVVVLTSDNGGVDFASSKSGDLPPTSNAPLRAGKGTLYEGGIRVPLMVRWPGITQKGARTAAPVISQDFYSTLAIELAGIHPESLPPHDGRNLMPILREPQRTRPARTLYWHYPHYYPRMTPASAIREGDWKLIHFYEQDRMELFDLRDDPGELRDQARQQAGIAMRLRAKLDAWRRSVKANLPQPNPAFAMDDIQETATTSGE